MHNYYYIADHQNSLSNTTDQKLYNTTTHLNDSQSQLTDPVISSISHQNRIAKNVRLQNRNLLMFLYFSSIITTNTTI